MRLRREEASFFFFLFFPGGQGQRRESPREGGGERYKPCPNSHTSVCILAVHFFLWCTNFNLGSVAPNHLLHLPAVIMFFLAAASSSATVLTANFKKKVKATIFF